jgi:2,4-dienoyl-CoA reductase-like NADH-dependent reductase (Old Yellow Enzyme family)
MVEGGLTIEDTKVIAQLLEEAGIAALHVSAGVYKSGAIVSAPSAVRTAPFSDYERNHSEQKARFVSGKTGSDQ